MGPFFGAIYAALTVGLVTFVLLITPRRTKR
jgi:hypothetical protein